MQAIGQRNGPPAAGRAVRRPIGVEYQFLAWFSEQRGARGYGLRLRSIAVAIERNPVNPLCAAGIARGLDGWGCRRRISSTSLIHLEYSGFGVPLRAEAGKCGTPHGGKLLVILRSSGDGVGDFID